MEKMRFSAGIHDTRIGFRYERDNVRQFKPFYVHIVAQWFPPIRPHALAACHVIISDPSVDMRNPGYLGKYIGRAPIAHIKTEYTAYLGNYLPILHALCLNRL